MGKNPVEWTKRWGWNMFGVSLGTGSVAVAISSIPYSFRGQTELATVWLILTIVFWLFNLVMTALRAIRHPKVFHQSFYDQNEAPWVGVALMTAAPILVVSIQQGVPRTGEWLVRACEVCFYLYIAIGWIISWTLQSTFRRIPRSLGLVTATDLYEVLPMVLGGAIGSTLCTELVSISPSRALTMMLFSLVLAGLSFWVSILASKLAVWMVHHITLVHAPASLLPTYMTAAGPVGFCALVLTNVAQASLTILPRNEAFLGLSIDTETAAEGFAMAGLWFAIFLLGLYAWVVLSWIPWGLAHLSRNILHGRVGNYAPTCWSWTFPTLGYIACFGKYASIFPSKAFGVLNIIGVFYLLVAWGANLLLTIHLLLWRRSPPGTTDEYDQAVYEDMLQGDWEPIRDHREVSKEMEQLRRRLEGLEQRLR